MFCFVISRQLVQHAFFPILSLSFVEAYVSEVVQCVNGLPASGANSLFSVVEDVNQIGLLQVTPW